MTHLLSAKRRAETIEKLQSEKFELLIIGGGITGAGIALDAASRGIKTALIEMQDYAAGTSSRSTKLVHGGLRYLEHLELGLVREVGREREIVHTNAAHIVIPEKMILPIIEGGNLGDFTTSLALYVYDFLAGVKKEENKQMLSKEETLKKIPLLESNLLKSGALYYEYRTDDSRLTIEVLKKAQEYDATMLNYLKAEDFIYQNKKIAGVKAVDMFTNQTISISAQHVVNASGPWTDEIRKKDNSLKGKRLHHSKGVHIVVSKKDFNLNHAMYFDAGDKRMIFAIPRADIVYIGTTDTDYEGSLQDPKTTQDDAQYLLDTVNRIAPKAKLELKHIKSSWAGLRPLIHEDGKAPSELSRKDEIFYSDSKLISIAGGKLTGYRIIAKNVTNIVMKRISKQTGKPYVKCQTKKMRLSGGEFPFYPESRKIEAMYEKQYDEVFQTKITPDAFKKIFYRYGTNTKHITEKAFDYFNETKNSHSAWLKAEVWYSVFHEGCCTLSDFFIRRTGHIFFDIEKIDILKEEAGKYIAEFLNLSNKEIETQNQKLEEALKQARNFLH